jgi:hypothetical protein
MEKKFFFYNILPLCILLFFIKWFFFFDTKLEIDLLTKLIFEIKDWQYFTLIYNLSNFNFNPSYDPNLIELKFLPLPIYSILFHSIFINFFDIYGFIILEFLIILFFLIILISFFEKLGISKIESIFLTIFLFCIPNLIEYFELYKINYLRVVGELYNLRIPRPSISHLYLFSFFLLLISIKKNNELKIKQLILIGLIFSLMWGSYYYNLVISGITFIIYYLYLTHDSNQNFIKYIKDTFLVLFSFIFFSIPIIFIILNSEPDWLIRVGLFELDIDKKKILLSHFLEKILSIRFVTIFIFITLFYQFLRFKKIYKMEGINLLYFIFLGSFLAPLIFIIISPTISEAYNFANMIVALSFFVTLTFSFLIISIYLRVFSWNTHIFKTSIVSLLIFYTLSNYTISKKNDLNSDKINFDQLITEVKKINLNKNTEILTFDAMLQTHLILNDYKNLTNTYAIITSLTDEMIEDKLIEIFKFFNLNKIDFYNFIKNEKSGWRFVNNNIGETFYFKYQANNLTTYKNSMDFTPEELKYILKSSPLHTQQLIIPKFEIKRLIDKFVNFERNKKINPNLIIINSKDIFTKNLRIDNKLYCSKKINKDYVIYFIKKTNLNC